MEMGLPPFSPSSTTLLLLLLSLLPTSTLSQPLPPAEQEATYLVLESINPDIDWRNLYPDDLCLSGPHGVVCDLFPDSSAHVAELHFGYVSDYNPNPSCADRPTFSPHLSSVAFPFLRKLFLYRCFLDPLSPTQLPDHLWEGLSASLEELVLIDNPSLSGTLSGKIGDFARLRNLVVTGTGVAGPVPPEIGNLRRLQELDLSRSLFTGPIPSTIGSCTDLKIIDLSGNRITGSIPPEIGRLRELVKLDLSGNAVSGSIPGELSALRALELLDVSGNNLTGGVPAAALSRMGRLREVHLSNNVLMSGRISEEMWANLSGVVGIGFSNMGLVGEIPGSMGIYLSNISYLAMDGNRLEGEVPAELRRLEATAREINLENNRLRGRVPFSSEFAARVGKKLRLAGNAGLCWPAAADNEGVKVKVESRGGGLGRCNETHVVSTRPVRISSPSDDHAAVAASVSPAWPLSRALLLVLVSFASLS